jgi:hypothetical protein
MNQKDFEASLQKGQEVRLRWRGKFALATVFRVNKSSISVVTKEKLDDIPAGTRVLVDRATSGRRSASNCVRPLI